MEYNLLEFRMGKSDFVDKPFGCFSFILEFSNEDCDKIWHHMTG